MLGVARRSNRVLLGALAQRPGETRRSAHISRVVRRGRHAHGFVGPLRGSPVLWGDSRWSSGEETMNAKHCSRMVCEGEHVAESVFAAPVAEADVTLTKPHRSTRDTVRHPRASPGLPVS